MLVSGAWHAGWCWDRVVPLLEAAGHKAFAPDLLGMGDEATPLAQVTLARWADQIAELVRAIEEPVVLVGHSRGGIVISEVAERVPDRIVTLVYLAAFLVPSGSNLLETSADHQREGLAGVLRSGPIEGTTVVNPDMFGAAFYNLTDAIWVERAKSQVSAEPMAVFSTRLALTDAGFGSVPRAYIECTQDNAVPLALQRLMQRALPCDRVFTLESDHSPFFSAPEQLADCLLRLR